jgi:three-Cys-motif partner protein
MVPIMRRWHHRVVFIDGFAGPGVYEGGEPGSPIVTVRALLHHKYFKDWTSNNFTFLFCEPEPKRFESLESRIAELTAQTPLPGNVSLNLVDEPFDEVGRQILDSLSTSGGRLAPTLAFLDPFGIKGLPMETVADLMSFDRGEVLLNFAVKNMARFTSTKEMAPHLDRLFGSDAWRAALDVGVAERPRLLLKLYVEALEANCRFDYTWPFEMVSAGTTSYYLVYGTRHIKGLEVMKDSMWKVAPSGRFRFSSTLEDNHITLEDPAASSHFFQQALLRTFAGKSPTIGEVEQFVLIKTPYRKAHTRREGLLPLERAGSIEVQRPGKHGFPMGTRIVFPAS